MTHAMPCKISLNEWDARYGKLKEDGLQEPSYGGSLRRHFDDGDCRLGSLRFDNSEAALRLWNFLLSEEDRLRQARESGDRIVGAMKDLGTVPVIAYSFPGITAFYPDGAWWIPCVMQLSAGLLEVADSLGINESFCPVRAMIGAFVTGNHFPLPDLLICSAGATCDDFSAIAQRVAGLGHEITWWNIPHRRAPGPGEDSVTLPGGFEAPADLVEFVEKELDRVSGEIAELSGVELCDELLVKGIQNANEVRSILRDLRRKVFTARKCPLPALELLVAEMLAIHFCSDIAEARIVLEELLAEVQRRIDDDAGIVSDDAVRVFWVNPVADIRTMNLLEECGGRVCGTENLFCHAIDAIPEDVPPMKALAMTALADPMIGSAGDRAERICRDIVEFGSEAVVVSRIPGASHCATEGAEIIEVVRESVGIPVQEIEVPPVMDPVEPTIRTRIEALCETACERRGTGR